MSERKGWERLGVGFIVGEVEKTGVMVVVQEESKEEWEWRWEAEEEADWEKLGGSRLEVRRVVSGLEGLEGLGGLKWVHDCETRMLHTDCTIVTWSEL
jgi:hypothetical protein